MKKFLLALLGLVVVVIGAALTLPFLLPTDTYKQRIAQVERLTGRKLAISGPLDFTMLPTVAVTAEEVVSPTSRAAERRRWWASRACRPSSRSGRCCAAPSRWTASS